MGKHKTNPVVQLAKDGKLPPKTQTLGKRETERLVQATLRNNLYGRFGIDLLRMGPY